MRFVDDGGVPGNAADSLFHPRSEMVRADADHVAVERGVSAALLQVFVGQDDALAERAAEREEGRVDLVWIEVYTGVEKGLREAVFLAGRTASGEFPSIEFGMVRADSTHAQLQRSDAWMINN